MYNLSLSLSIYLLCIYIYIYIAHFSMVMTSRGGPQHRAPAPAIQKR